MSLETLIEELARTPVLLIGCDYDGTIAPIVSDPSQAHPDREVMVALKQLSSLPDSHVSVISGRSLEDLARLATVPDEIHLVGSHGSEFDPGFAQGLPADATALHGELIEQLTRIALGDPDVILETKPASVAFHYRNVDEERSQILVDAVLSGPGRLHGIHTKHGKKVLEFSVIDTNKGHALDRIRSMVGATAALYIGDDRTDEDAFATLRGPDVGIKVGEGETRAGERVEDPRQVARVLAALAERRAEWLSGARSVPIEAHSMLSDLRTVALVTPDARVAWLCAPRIDSGAVFAEILGGPTAGTFAVGPADGSAPLEQDYLEDSLVLRTAWHSMVAIDYLDCSSGRPVQRAGRSDLVRTLRGRGRASLEFAPRLDYGRVGTRLTVRENGLALEDSQDPIVLYSPGVDWELVDEGPHHTARAEVELGEEPLVLVLRYGTGNLDRSSLPELQCQRQTRSFWNQWARGLRSVSVATDAVRRSALVLKGLCHGPTGAIAAAATTSLPEHLGGVRNWDYRFCWLRDGALAVEALARLGSHAEALGFLGWALGVVDQEQAGPERLRPLYSVNGHVLGPEGEIPDLPGYAGSRPVRVGNAAAQQVQLDVFGPIVSLVDVLVELGAAVSAEHWRLVEALVTAVARRWKEPDHGIWEIRGPRRHYLHSKVMCWLAVDRAIDVGKRFLGVEREDWHGLRGEIAGSILERGWNEEAGCFTTAYGSPELDAASLQVGLSGLLPPDDPRFVATVERVEAALLQDATLRRYDFDDGLPGREGGFHLCTSWLIEARASMGRLDAARALLEELVACSGPTGLLPEEHDPVTGRGLGNHPQAYSHTGLVNAALRIEQVQG